MNTLPGRPAVVPVTPGRGPDMDPRKYMRLAAAVRDLITDGTLAPGQLA